MKKKDIPVQQYAFQTVNVEGASDDFLEKTAPLIGYIVHTFNALEDTLNSTICGLINERTDLSGLVLIQKLNFSSKVDLLKRYILMEEFYDIKHSANFEEMISKLNEAGNLRNQVVHADWESAFEDGYTRCKLKINSHGVKHEYIQFTPESLDKIIKLIDDANTMLYDYFDED